MAATKGTGSVYKDARGYWNASISLPSKADGTRRRKVIRRKSKLAVIAELNKLRNDLELNGDVLTRTKTVDAWFEYWLQKIVIPHRRPNTVAAYRASMNEHILPIIGKLRLGKLTAAHVRQVLDAMEDAGLSSTTAKQTHGIMSSAFEEAVREGELQMNPTKRVRAPRRAHVDSPALNLDEAIRLLHAASQDPLYGARWATALLTGARRGEVLGLTLDNITDVLDFSWQLQVIRDVRGVGEPVVPNGYNYRHLTGRYYLTPPKSSAGTRVVPLFEPLRSILERHIQETPENPWGLLFAPLNRPIQDREDRASLQRLLVAAGIDKKITPHSLRHTAVDLLYFAGAPEDLIVTIVGHSNRAMSRSYKSRGVDARTRDMLDRFGAIFTPPQLGSLPSEPVDVEETSDKAS